MKEGMGRWRRGRKQPLDDLK